MKLLRYEHAGKVSSGILDGGQVHPVAPTILEIIQSGILPQPSANAVPLADCTPLLPYDVPPKIWCIGLNYHSHAVDIQAVQPEEPGSFMKPSSCLMQPGGEIVLPPVDVSNEVDAEGELVVVIGRTCRFVPADKVPGVIFGYTTSLDLTALDVLRKNPRYLTRAKATDTFFSFGPVIVTADEVPDVDALEVITEQNGEVYSRDFVRNMKHRPYELVRFHSEYMTLHPGDIISTGCPKGARIKPGDRVAARIDGVGRLTATVRQGERIPQY